MKFDTIIGNPPYNNDIYLEFINQLQPLTNQLSMITPAKWYCKFDQINEQFRNTVLPYMSDIVFYRDTKDIFDIGEAAGIVYFLLTNEITPTKLVKNICLRNSNLNTETFEEHGENPFLPYPIHIVNIINKIQTVTKLEQQPTLDTILNFTRCVFVDEQEYGVQLEQSDDKSDYYELMQSDKPVGWIHQDNLFTHQNLNKYKCVQACMSCQGSHSPFDINGLALGSAKVAVLTPNQVPKGSFPIIRYFNTEQEAKNFQSYMHSRLVSFLQFIGLSGTTITKEFYRFVPDQPNWKSDIWTKSIKDVDNYLYTKYGLTEDEVGTIQSIIKQNDRT